MQHIKGLSRQGLQMNNLEDKIGTENPVRFIDAIVDYISYKSIGFAIHTIKSERKHEQNNRFLNCKKNYCASTKSQKNLKITP
jgi:hypothetical protein